jgi:hypothetical protein
LDICRPRPFDEAALYPQLIAKVRTAIDQIEALMLSDAWDAIPPERQRALADVTQQMRADVARIEEALRPGPFSDED